MGLKQNKKERENDWRERGGGMKQEIKEWERLGVATWEKIIEYKRE